MQAVNWPAGVNSKFYGLKETPDDNAVITEYSDGRKAVVLRGTRWLRKISVNVCLDIREGETEAFWKWYQDTLGGMAGAFKCDALGEGTVWRFTSTPSDGGGIPCKEYSLELEEAI